MARASYLQRREGRYYLQIRFSRSVATLFGREQYRSSLKTTCYKEAKLRLTEVLSWFHRMNDALDYTALFRKNIIELRRYLTDQWPLSDERLFARKNYEELLKNLNRRARADGFQPESIDPEFNELLNTFVRQNVEAEGYQQQSRLDDAYERGRVDMRASMKSSVVPSSFRSNEASFEGIATNRNSTSAEEIISSSTAYASPTAIAAQRPTAMPTAPEEAGPVSPLLSAALAEYVQKQVENGAKKDPVYEVKLVVQFLIDEFDDPTIAEISDDMVKQIDAMLPEIPDRTNIPKLKATTLSRRYRYAQTHGWEGLKRLTEARLRNGYHNSLSKFFGWLVERGYFTRTKPVFSKVSGKNLASFKRDAFQDDEITKIINLPLFSGCQTETRHWQPGNVFKQCHLYWSYVLLLLTGLRPGELGQLQTGDIEERGGIYYLHLRPFDPSKGRVALEDVKRFKTEASQRLVPLHPLIIDLGITERVEDLKALNCPYLFPEWEPYPKPDGEIRWGQPITKSWQYIKRILEIDRADVALYSTRHWFADLIDNTDIKDRSRKIVMGHKADSSSSSVYGAKTRLTARDLREILAAESPMIDLMTEVLLSAKERAIRGELLVVKPWRNKENWSDYYRAKMSV